MYRDREDRNRRSRSRERSGDRERRDPQRGGGDRKRESGFSARPSGFSTKPSAASSRFSSEPPVGGPNQPPANHRQSTQELLDAYKQYNQGQTATSHNKAERQLYIGNIPESISQEALTQELNMQLKRLGKDVGIFQDGNPIITSWISQDGHYAFVDFRTVDEATQGFVLQQVQMKGTFLRVGRPKNAKGVIPLPSQLLCGDPNFNPTNPQASQQQQKKATSASLVQQALRQSRVQESKKLADVAYEKRLMVSNLPTEHDEQVVLDFCKCFGEATKVEFIINEGTGKYDGSAYIDFGSEFEAKKVYSTMMGKQFGKGVLFIKKCAPPTEEELAEQLGEEADNPEIFGQIIEDKPTKCLILNNVVQLEDNHDPEDLKELEFDVLDEMMKYGNVVKVHVPRLPKYGASNINSAATKEFGRVFVQYTTTEEAEKAKNALFNRRFNSKYVEVTYHNEDLIKDSKFLKAIVNEAAAAFANPENKFSQ